MGRHRRQVSKTPYNGSLELEETVEERLGLTSLICESCNARNTKTADTCRKCNHPNLREKASDYRDK